MAKEIIIDGVDICNCIHRQRATEDCTVCNAYSNKVFEWTCYEFKHCYFKELKRAEQKLNKIKEIVMLIKEYTCMERHCDTINQILQIIEGEENG